MRLKSVCVAVTYLLVHSTEFLRTKDTIKVSDTRVMVDKHITQVEVVEGAECAPIGQDVLVLVPYKPKHIPMEASILLTPVAALKTAENSHVLPKNVKGLGGEEDHANLMRQTACRLRRMHFDP